MSGEESFDVCVVGGGLVGLGVARAIAERFDGVSIVVLEKEQALARHQSSHNSGVVHSGLYYRPGSLKARLCVEGREAIEAMAESTGIPYRRTGKLVVATDQSEIPALDELERRGRANGLTRLRRLAPGEIAEVEPAAVGVSALWVGDAGVVDFSAIADRHARVLETMGGRVITGSEVTAITHESPGVVVTAGDRRVRTRALVNCAGLHSDLVARMAGSSPPVRIVPFRGEYYHLKGDSAGMVRGLIYPVPDPRLPFLGVHFTRRVEGTVEVGPNAILGLGREHYRGSPIDWAELRSILAHPGFWRLARRYWRHGAAEMLHTRSARLYARLARRLVPEITHADLVPGGAGVRAQALDR
ncbi:MAG TPA: L-2-hydroxyglutarate oxidase, partial [Acidimicrobiia bacterium]|nr:L-2-hydroxyglutarate oxidase [Acidimicrobiia bacterium]